MKRIREVAAKNVSAERARKSLSVNR